MQGCGRARGRAVNKQQPKPTTQEHAAPRASATPIGRGFQAAPIPTQSAWGQSVRSAEPPPGAVSQRSVAVPAGALAAAAVRHATPAPVVLGGEGRASVHRGGGAAGETANRGDAGGPLTEATRGTARGRRILTDIIRTKPVEMSTKKGLTGECVPLTTNYFKLDKKPEWALYQYRVDFSPTLELRGLRNRMIFEQKKTLGGYLFDGTVLYITRKLPQETTEFMSKDRDGNPIQTIVKFVALVSMNTASAIQVLNLILRRAMDGLKLQLVGRNLFDAAAKINIPEHNIQLWPGYITSIRQHELDILLCCEMTTKVMRTETALDIIMNIHRNERNVTEAIQLALLGLTVLTDYNNKTYRIDDIDFTKKPTDTFDTKDGPVSFIDYYKNRYNLTIRDRNQPLLISKAKARDMRGNPDQSELICLIPELCRATGLTDAMKKNFRLATAMSAETRMSPAVRLRKLADFNARLAGTKESVEMLQDWNVSLSKKLVELPGRVLNPEKICFDQKKCPTNKEVDWTREFHNTAMYRVVPCSNWYIIFPRRNERETEEFVKLLLIAARGMNYNMTQPNVCAMNDDRAQTYIRALDDCLNKDPALVMVVVPNDNADRYSNIKKKCCVERPVPSQVINVRTITPKNPRGLQSVATKVVIQMNAKLGGAPWGVELPLTGLMTIGFDVCHDTKDKSKSYGAMVATMDLKTNHKFFSAVSAHRNGEELSNEFTLNVVKALMEFRQVQKVLPSKILVFRDGVGEGQTDYVYEHEIQVLRKKLQEVYSSAGIEGGYRLCFIVVSKRINTRLFWRGENAKPGTIVDDIITLPERYDFFLVSQSCRQGTVSPTNYNVLFDNMGLSPDRIQLLSYKMCHLYYNWSGTTRVPSVCQYAHKLAFLVGNFIHQAPSNVLEKRLYFL